MVFKTFQKYKNKSSCRKCFVVTMSEISTQNILYSGYAKVTKSDSYSSE
jgi:hypothetical protein